MNKWECFYDECYYGLWAVREVGEKRWGHCFHVQTKEESEGLRDLLNELSSKPNADLERKALSDGTLQDFVVPCELWERMRQAVFRISCGREVCAGSPAYDPGPCDKAAVDKLVEDIQRHNARGEAWAVWGNEVEPNNTSSAKQPLHGGGGRGKGIGEGV